MKYYMTSDEEKALKRLQQIMPSLERLVAILPQIEKVLDHHAVECLLFDSETFRKSVEKSNIAAITPLMIHIKKLAEYRDKTKRGNAPERNKKSKEK